MNNQEQWYRFYDEAYEYLEQHDIGPCPVGAICSPVAWSCCTCPDWSDRDGPFLPHEEDWQKKQLADGRKFKRESEACANECGVTAVPIMCRLWPTIPFVSPNGDILVQLWFWCEGMFQASEYYCEMIDIAQHLNEMLWDKHRMIRNEYLITMLEVFSVSGELCITLTPEVAKKLLRSDSGKKSAVELMKIVGTKTMNGSFKTMYG